MTGILASALFLILQSIPVFAAEDRIRLRTDGLKQGDTQLEVSCQAASPETISNGKIRIKYDSSLLVLKENTAGKALESIMYQINDCLTGNKEEGEIVLAFASSTALFQEGSLLDMKFQVSDSLKSGDTIHMEAVVEELSQSQGENEVREIPLDIMVGEKVKPPVPEDTGDAETEGEDTQKEESSSGNKSASGTSLSGKGARQARKVKTGDETNWLIPGGLLLVSGGVITILLKRKRKLPH